MKVGCMRCSRYVYHDKRELDGALLTKCKTYAVTELQVAEFGSK